MDDYDDDGPFCCPACGEEGECDCTPERILLAEKRQRLLQLQHEIEELEGEPSLEQFWDQIEGYSSLMFADPGGGSALTAEFPGNPRIYDCPTCGRHNILTRIDVFKHYQCNRCADALERGF